MRLTGLPVPLSLPDAPARRTADTSPGWPCRRCLTDADVGEVLLLVPYDPWTVDSPYRQPGPVFVHERACAPWTGDGVPEQQTSRLLSLRGFGADGLSTVAEVVPGAQVEERLAEVLADPGTAFVHLHNAAPGCFAARVDR